ncbi:unnamed protein product [Spirodela intermedia]|uniref:DYW domain-containing protein n=1 Tax=Spirodela intermedia TaxID=51605 RepID=A0A7I8IRT7_SPIIN|nr:unnamed protein product [Spirodela intermedia]CAA6660693.1 unnamed protein product [Spirodela intermedia]
MNRRSSSSVAYSVPVQRHIICSRKSPTEALFLSSPARRRRAQCVAVWVLADGELRQVLGLFAQIFRSGGAADESTFSCTLKACGCAGDAALGRQLHGCSAKRGLGEHVSVGTSLVDMYMKLGAVEEGRRVFDSMPKRNVVSWSSLLTGYTQNGQQGVVLEIFGRMMEEGVKPNPYTFASVLTASSGLQAVETGLKAHGLVIRFGFEAAVFVCNSLVNMYSKCGLTADARKVFDNMGEIDSVSWNAMVAGLVQNELDREALELFRQMRAEGANLTQLSFAAVMKACAGVGELGFGRQLHCCAMKKGFASDGNIGTALTVVYCKSGEMDEGFRVFSTMGPSRNVVSWTAIICGYLTNGRPDQAAAIFLQMRREDAMPNEFTFSAMLTASLSSPAPDPCPGHKIRPRDLSLRGHGPDERLHQPGPHRRGSVRLQGIEDKDIVAWSAMLAAYAQVGDSEAAVRLFCEMTRRRVSPNEFTMSSVIDSCSGPSAAVDQGKQFHGVSIKLGLEEAICVSSALVTMYSKKGSIESAYGVFSRQRERDLISWNSMVCGYAQHGYGSKSLQLFTEMQSLGLEPDGVTFIGVITACTHAGLVDDGRRFFDSMLDPPHPITPTEEHYACMVDLYSRAGRFAEAMEMVRKMPSPAGATVWRTLLGACRVHKNLALGRLAAERLLSLEPEHSAAYVLLSNIYAAAGRWEDRAAVRRLMEAKGVKKEAAWSWIEVKKKVHSFLAGDRSHPFSERLYERLEELLSKLRAAGHRPDTGFVLHDVEEEQKEGMVGEHSEKLALAFGLMATPQGAPLQVVKNLRVCGDCHAVFKLASAAEGRAIVLRDSTRFHHFRDGSCSCGDYW